MVLVCRGVSSAREGSQHITSSPDCHHYCYAYTKEWEKIFSAQIMLQEHVVYATPPGPVGSLAGEGAGLVLG